MNESLFSELFYLEHKSGDTLYPIRIKNRESEKIAFRLSKGGTGGNTKDAGIEIDSEQEVKRLVLDMGYAVRAATKNRSRNGLYKVGQRSISKVVCL